MATPPLSSPQLWLNRASQALLSALSFIVFTALDLVDILLCFVYRFLDRVIEGSSTQCYCRTTEDSGEEVDEDISETLYQRRNVFRVTGTGNFAGRKVKERMRSPRWSDCGCESCVGWKGRGEEKLHLVVMEPSRETSRDCTRDAVGSVIFIHGFLSSSSMWVDTVLPNLSETAKNDLRMFAVDLLGFGKSPKPGDCMYRLKDHIDMIETSIIKPYELESFHLVAHSMGCIIAMSIAAKYPELVKSVTLIAPPYFPSTEVKASQNALHILAERKVWPPLLFGSSVMSWYEHLGRTVCFVICRNHLRWEKLMKLLTRRRDLHFIITDITKHTHRSAWHTMHNVVCGGAKFMDKYMEVVKRAGIFVRIIQGDEDRVVPVECSYNLKAKIPHSELQIIRAADHTTVILGREKDFMRDLEKTWFASEKF